jgi:uncharacterized protein (DUF58 family)
MSAIRALVSAEDLAALDKLELVADRVVDGFLAGRHESRMKGGCSEFAEHRAYSPGDEVRGLDWRVVAKSDRYFIKQFHESSTLSAVFVLDTSGSMAYGDSTLSKFLHARAAAACLSRLVLGQRDPVALAITGQAYLPARATPNHFLAILDALVCAQPAGPNALLETLSKLQNLIRTRSQIVLLTDAFVALDALEPLLLTFAARGHRLLLFHVLAPEELTFPFRDGTRFESLEGSDEFRDVDPAAFAQTYLERLQHFIQRLRRACHNAGGDYQPLPTDQPLGPTLADYLRKRARRSR